MSSGCTFLLFNIFIAILFSVWAATVLKDSTTFGKYVWTPLSSVCIAIVTCEVILFGHFLQVTCIHFTITVGARFVALFHYFAIKYLNLHFKCQFLTLLFSAREESLHSNSSCLERKLSRGIRVLRSTDSTRPTYQLGPVTNRLRSLSRPTRLSPTLQFRFSFEPVISAWCVFTVLSL